MPLTSIDCAALLSTLPFNLSEAFFGREPNTKELC